MSIKALEYNSQRDSLVIAEYGRHVHNLIQHAKTLDKKEERQDIVEGVAKLMAQMNPQTRNNPEYQERIWNHIFIIAGHDLDVTAPEGIDVNPKPSVEKGKLKYPQKQFKFRHYGSNIQILIAKAIELENEPEKQQEFVKIIAAYMKLAYRTWNKDYFVNDEIIKNDLERLSDNKLTLGEDVNIKNLSSNSRRRSNSNQRRGRKSRPGGSNQRGGSHQRRR